MNMTLKMIAVLRMMMPGINMVAATANQTLDPQGRQKAIAAGGVFGIVFFETASFFSGYRRTRQTTVFHRVGAQRVP